MHDIVERLTEAAAMRDELKERYWHRASSLKREAADEITRLRQLLSEAVKREKEARGKALEEAAKAAGSAFDPKSMCLITESQAQGRAFCSINRILAALQSEER